MPGEDRGEENREARRVEGVRRDGVTARGLELAGDEKADPREKADRHLHRRRQPPVVDRVAQKKDSADRQEDSGDPRKELHADEALPVDAARAAGGGATGDFSAPSRTSDGCAGRLGRSSSIGDFLRRGNCRRSKGHRRDRECDRRSGLLGPVFPFEENPDAAPGDASAEYEVAAAACSTSIFPFEERSTAAVCASTAGDEAGAAGREGAEIFRTSSLSALTSHSSSFTRSASRATRSRSHAPKPSAASPARSASTITASGPRQAAALRGAKIRS